MLKNDIINIRKSNFGGYIMKMPEIFIVKKKKSPLKAIIIVVSAIVAVAAAAAVAYKVWGSKIRSKIIGEVDLDGDGETEAIMLDTTGDGEIDTIILNTEEDTE